MKLFLVISAVSFLFIFSCKEDNQGVNDGVPPNSIYMVLSKGDTLKFDAYYVDFSDLDTLLLDTFRIGDSVLEFPFTDSLFDFSNVVLIDGFVEPCIGYQIDTSGGGFDIDPCDTDSTEKSLSIFWDKTQSSHYVNASGAYIEFPVGAFDSATAKSYHFNNSELILTENSADKIMGYMNNLQLTNLMRSDSIQVEKIMFNVSEDTFLKSFGRKHSSLHRMMKH